MSALIAQATTYDPSRYLYYLDRHERKEIINQVADGKYFLVRGHDGSRRQIEESPGGRTPEIAMMEFESKGVPLDATGCTNVKMLALYYAGKWWRDWHVTEWRSAVEKRLFLAEEFLEATSYDSHEFRAIFGRLPDLFTVRFLAKQEAKYQGHQ